MFIGKVNDKRNQLKSEEVSRTAHNKETFQDYIDQNLVMLPEKPKQGNKKDMNQQEIKRYF